MKAVAGGENVYPTINGLAAVKADKVFEVGIGMPPLYVYVLRCVRHVN